MTQQMTLERLREMRGKPVFDAEHEKIGGVQEIFIDDETRHPEWIGLGTGGMFGSEHHLVPIEGAEIERDGIKVPYTKDQVKKTPAYNDKDPNITKEFESQLYRSYGLEYSDRPSPSGLPEGKASEGKGGEPEGTQSMTRSEEEMRVGTRQTGAGTMRLRKYVDTEPVSEDVELRHERATVEREQINQPLSGGAEIGEEEVTMDLYGEEPVVEKQTTAKERVTLGKEEERTREQVTGEVRKERIEEEESR